MTAPRYWACSRKCRAGRVVDEHGRGCEQHHHVRPETIGRGAAVAGPLIADDTTPAVQGDEQPVDAVMLVLAEVLRRDVADALHAKKRKVHS